MPPLSPREMVSAHAIADLNYCNPFEPERIRLEREVLQEAFVWTDDAWHKRVDTSGAPPNIDPMTERSRYLADLMRAWLLDSNSISDGEIDVYENVVLYLLYNTYHGALQDLIVYASSETKEGSAGCHAHFYRSLFKDLKHYLGIPGYTFNSLEDPSHMFSCLFQVRRAFHFIHENIIGGSMSAARFRAAVWESIFTHDVRRYRRSLYRRMGDIATLIAGPSGTGKELVAQAIGLSRYIRFDVKTLRFDGNFAGSMYPLNLSALSSTLIESELFGHRKGAFTGALQDRKGWFEVCPPQGTIFLDEIGEVDQSIQVKLLRVLQSRSYQPIGGTDSKTFQGKIIAATNRDLAVEIEKGRFRTDLYYRLCSDLIVTPSLRDQIRETPDHLHNLLLFVCRNIAGDEEAGALAAEVESWIKENLGTDYPWHGNIRELEQCARNVLVRRAYTPPQQQGGSAHERLAEAAQKGNLSADELLDQYITLVYAQTRNYQETGRRLGLDGRTVKARVDKGLLATFG
jgi:DNA-binding NtrC family response regulator